MSHPRPRSRRRVDHESSGPGSIEVPAPFVRFPSVKDGAVDAESGPVETDSHHSHRDMARVERVVAERRRRIFRRRSAVHEGRGPKPDSPTGATTRRTAFVAERHAHDRRELRQEIVRVLIVDEWHVLVRLAHLEYVRVPARSISGRFQREHSERA